LAKGGDDLMIIIARRVGMCVCDVYDDGVIDLCFTILRVYIYTIHAEWDGRNGRFAFRSTDETAPAQGKEKIGEKDYRQQLRSCAAHASSSLSVFYFPNSFSLLFTFLSLLFPLKLGPLRQLISSSVIQPPLVSLPFSLLTLSVFGWWPVLEAVPKAAFLHLLLSLLRSVVDYCCFHFLAPPFHLFRIVQNNNNNSKEIKKKEL
jgi:hypothetical protein